MDSLRLLIVDDDLLHARLLATNLERPGSIKVDTADSGEAALDRLAQTSVDAVLADLVMPGMDGVELIRRIRETDTTLPVVIMTANATVDRAVEAVRGGATDFLQKPLNINAVRALLDRAVRDRPLRDGIATLREKRVTKGEPGTELGSHPRLDPVYAFVAQVAKVPATRVMITGESGTGKSMLARLIHERSGAPGRFVEVNCAALPTQLLESELFGYEKGAFTDAKTLKRGLIELAEKGTLFLDEIGAMPLELQAKLLLFLESREIRRVGGTQPIAINTRVITATNEDLRQQVRDRTFRQDLLYRLDVASLEMPALRLMPEIIPQLAERFTRDLCAEFHRPVPPFGPASFAGLLDYAWPGNARELRNAVERALIFHTGGPLVIAPPPRSIEAERVSAGVTLELGISLEEVERSYLAAVLQGGSRELGQIASQLGISRKTLWEKRRRHQL